MNECRWRGREEWWVEWSRVGDKGIGRLTCIPTAAVFKFCSVLGACCCCCCCCCMGTWPCVCAGTCARSFGGVRVG